MATFALHSRKSRATESRYGLHGLYLAPCCRVYFFYALFGSLQNHAFTDEDRSLARTSTRNCHYSGPNSCGICSVRFSFVQTKINQFLYIRVVNVEIGIYAQTSVLAELARCLALFSNMHTVQLKIEETDIRVPQRMIAKPLKDMFTTVFKQL